MVSILSTLSPAASSTQEIQNGKQAILHGRITDAMTGEPIAKVKVIVINSDRSATTDRNGEFVLPDLTEGELELYITTIGYGLVKKRITLQAGENNELRLALHQEAAQRLDEVTVTAGPFQQVDATALPARSILKRVMGTALNPQAVSLPACSVHLQRSMARCRENAARGWCQRGKVIFIT